MSALHRFLFDIRNPTLARSAIGAFVAPPLAMVIYGPLSSALLGKSGRLFKAVTLDGLLGMTAMTVIYGSIFAYVGMLVVGLPTFLALRRMRAQRGITYLFVGAICLPLLFVWNSWGLPSRPAPLLLAATPGCLVAGLWWALTSR